MKKILFVFIILLYGCGNNITGQNILCSDPYKMIGERCCIDKNNNTICDEDEKEIREYNLLKEGVELTQEEPRLITEIDDLADYKGRIPDFFEYEENNIRIVYPSDWDVMEDYYNAYVVFLSPLENEDDHFSENVNIMVQDLSSIGWNLEQYTMFSIAQIRGQFEDGIVLRSQEIAVSGLPGHYLLSVHRKGSLVLKSISVYTIKDNKAYLITYIAEEKNFDYYLDDVSEMIDSFRIG